MTPAEYCENRTRGAGSSFFYAFLFLPDDQRRAMMALYAFCREVDDIADEVSDSQVAMQKLQFWYEEIARTFSGHPNHPVGKELLWANDRFNLTEELFTEIMDGMRMDITRTPILKASELSLYCYRVAGAVGLLSIDIFGCHSNQARNFATTLGEALQLTNILRDIREDAGRDRIYIPQEDRIRFGVADQAFKQDEASDRMQALLAHYGDRAEACYTRAMDLIPDDERSALRPSLVMGAIYHRYLSLLKKRRFDVWQQPPRLLPLTKIWIAWRAWRYEKRAANRGMPVRFDF
ncbi:MAG TPA: presqualene diphosphate synthase HpnD [Mariprofundaceae bacterium]|nr:presqualene diphosphate synthase HpnD [Mariprofundaceae bacterium]